jgi:hypothetical protein
MTRKSLREGSQNAKYCIFFWHAVVGVVFECRATPGDRHQTGSGAAFIRSMLKRLLTLRSGTAAISLR